MSIDENGRRPFPTGFYLIRGFGIVILLWIIKFLMSVFVTAVYTNTFDTTSFIGDSVAPHWAICLIVAVGDMFIFNSLIHIFSVYDRKVMKDFLGLHLRGVKFGEEIPRILKSPEFITETASITVLTAIIALIGGFSEFSGVFLNTGAPEGLLLWLPIIIPIPIFFVLNVLARYETRRRWHWLWHVGNTSSLYSVPRLIIRALAIPLLYIFVYPFAPVILFAYLGIFGTIADLIDMLTVAGFIAALILIVFFIFACLALNSIRLRKRLIKRLRTVAYENDYTLSEIKHPYASLFRTYKECNFTLTRGERVFSCRFIGSFWRRAPMYFVSNKHAYYRHRIGTKNHHFTLLAQFEYDFEGEGEKIIILNPVPRRAYAANSTYVENPTYADEIESHGEKGSKARRAENERALEPGDRIWGYGIYNTTSFLGAVDRKCLGRYNGMFE